MQRIRRLRTLSLSFALTFLAGVGGLGLALGSVVTGGFSATTLVGMLIALLSAGGSITAYQESVREHNERVAREDQIIDDGDTMRIERRMSQLAWQLRQQANNSDNKE